MRTLTGPAFATLLARADVSQAAFARLVGVTPRQVNNWCRGRAAVPVWAAILTRVLQHRLSRSPDHRSRGSQPGPDRASGPKALTRSFSQIATPAEPLRVAPEIAKGGRQSASASAGSRANADRGCSKSSMACNPPLRLRVAVPGSESKPN